MKNIIRIVLIALLVLLVCHSCFGNNRYRFPNPLEEIEKVELLYNPNRFSAEDPVYEFVLMRELQSEEVAPFMTEIYQLKTDKYGPPPRRGYGWYIVRVTYSNGDVEMLGSYNIAYIRSGKPQHSTGIYYFPDNGLTELLKNYVNLSEYPEG